MKIKSNINLKSKIEKKNSSMLNIFDTYAEKIESFSLNFNCKYDIINYNNRYRNIIYLNGLYPRIKLTSKYEPYHMKLCNIENFIIPNKVSSVKVNKIINIDNQINNDNLGNSENKEINPKLEYNNENHLEIGKQLINLKNISTNDLKKKKSKKNQKNNININSDLSNIIKNKENLSFDNINIIPIVKDGNCFYRCLSYFFLSNQEYYKEFKEIIIEWIENNYKKFESFFGDDEKNKISKEILAKEEFDYIKSKDSWGSDYTITIASLLFNLNIAVYIFNNNNNELKPYHFFENFENSNNELMILSYHTNYHFELIYSKKEDQSNIAVYNNFKEIIINDNINKENIKISGVKFSNNYVKIKTNNNNNLYNEIFDYLYSININNNEIEKLKIQNPNWHYNQILSKFNIKYPVRMEGKDVTNVERRKNFRKTAENYKLDDNNRLCVLNPIKKSSNSNIYYKIPFEHEKEIIISDCHSNNNHAGRDSTYNYILNEKWYWLGIIDDIKNFINVCPNCANQNKFKKLQSKIKIVIENGPHYRYVADIWHLPKEISDKVDYKYVLDIVDHFSKWYYGYLLYSKEGKEILKNIEKYIENFGKPNILQTDNGKEFDNQFLKTYCVDNNIKLIHSSPYHPQTNGTVEVTHKEIQKYIFNEFIKNKNNFKIDDALFNIIKIHNNKIHTTTKRIPKDIRDLSDENEINIIKKEIINTLEKKNKYKDIIEYDKFYVIDETNVIISNNKILKNKKKKKKKKLKSLSKIPITVLTQANGDDEYVIEIKKTLNDFIEGKIYEIEINLLEEVNEELWNNLL